MATFCCPIETEPKTLNQVELNHARVHIYDTSSSKHEHVLCLLSFSFFLFVINRKLLLVFWKKMNHLKLLVSSMRSIKGVMLLCVHVIKRWKILISWYECCRVWNQLSELKRWQWLLIERIQFTGFKACLRLVKQFASVLWSVLCPLLIKVNWRSLFLLLFDHVYELKILCYDQLMKFSFTCWWFPSWNDIWLFTSKFYIMTPLMRIDFPVFSFTWWWFQLFYKWTPFFKSIW